MEIVDRKTLEEFATSWKLHNPLKPNQLSFAGQRARVELVSYYFGGDELYELDGIPGVWHEQHLREVESK